MEFNPHRFIDGEFELVSNVPTYRLTFAVGISG
jgi:hypothetical protein